MAFDPNAAATDADNVFGLPHSREDASVVLIPVPYDATSPTAWAPPTPRRPSAKPPQQVDLFDRRFGNIYERGIHMEPHPPEIREWSAEARASPNPSSSTAGPKQGDEDAVARVDQFSAVPASLRPRPRHRRDDDGKVPGLIGGEHGVAFGLYKAVAERHPGVGILQIDAHMDLRPAFEGFAWSHASVMHNVVHDLDGVSRIVQVGIRDYCEQEAALAESLAPDKAPEGETQIITFFWDDLADERLGGGAWPVAASASSTAPRGGHHRHRHRRARPHPLPPHRHPGARRALLGPALRPAPDDQGIRALRRRVRPRRGLPQPVPEAPPTDASIGARVLYRLCGCV
jgi:agmatinase